MYQRAGFTRIELVAIVLVAAVLLSLLLPRVARQREEARQVRCRNNLGQIARGMIVYLGMYGDSRWHTCPLGRGARPDDYNGAEWLASLYWVGGLPDPGVFICPSSGDTNRDGADIGQYRAAPTFGNQTVSYAGIHYYSGRDERGTRIPYVIPHDSPPNLPIASDDTQGDINHETMAGGMNVLFLDAHAAYSTTFRTNTDLDPRRAVGDPAPGALLRDLRN
jgi:prepilin-type processing-associated H-X9-DG protein